MLTCKPPGDALSSPLPHACKAGRTLSSSCVPGLRLQEQRGPSSHTPPPSAGTRAARVHVFIGAFGAVLAGGGGRAGQCFKEGAALPWIPQLIQYYGLREEGLE